MTPAQWENESSDLISNLLEWRADLRNALRKLAAIHNLPSPLPPGPGDEFDESTWDGNEELNKMAEEVVTSWSGRYMGKLMSWIDRLMPMFAKYREGFEKGDNSKDKEARKFIAEVQDYYDSFYHRHGGIDDLIPKVLE